MKNILTLFCVLFLFSGCATHKNRTADLAIGMTKQEILNKIGEPDSVANVPVQKMEKLTLPLPEYFQFQGLYYAAMGDMDSARSYMKNSLDSRNLPDMQSKAIVLAQQFQDLSLEFAKNKEGEKAFEALEKANNLISIELPNPPQYETRDIEIPVNSTETSEWWAYYGKRGEGYRNFALRFDKSGKLCEKKILGYNMEQAQIDYNRQQQQLQAATALLNYSNQIQQQQNYNYYQRQQQQNLQNINNSLQSINNTLRQY